MIKNEHFGGIEMFLSFVKRNVRISKKKWTILVILPILFLKSYIAFAQNKPYPEDFDKYRDEERTFLKRIDVGFSWVNTKPVIRAHQPLEVSVDHDTELTGFSPVELISMFSNTTEKIELSNFTEIRLNEISLSALFVEESFDFEPHSAFELELFLAYGWTDRNESFGDGIIFIQEPEPSKLIKIHTESSYKIISGGFTGSFRLTLPMGNFTLSPLMGIDLGVFGSFGSLIDVHLSDYEALGLNMATHELYSEGAPSNDLEEFIRFLYGIEVDIGARIRSQLRFSIGTDRKSIGIRLGVVLDVPFKTPDAKPIIPEFN